MVNPRVNLDWDEGGGSEEGVTKCSLSNINAYLEIKFKLQEVVENISWERFSSSQLRRITGAISRELIKWTEEFDDKIIRLFML